MIPLAHMIAVSVALGAASVFAGRFLLHAGAAPQQSGPILVLLPRELVLLGAIGLGALLAEGAIGDWAAVYLREVLATSATTAALAFSSFSLAMARDASSATVSSHGWGRSACWPMAGWFAPPLSPSR